MKSETTNSTWHFYYYFKSFEALKSFMFTKKLKLWQTFSNVHNLYRVSNNDGKGQLHKIYKHWIEWSLNLKKVVQWCVFTSLFIISIKLYHQASKYLAILLIPALCILSKYIFTFYLKSFLFFGNTLTFQRKLSSKYFHFTQISCTFRKNKTLWPHMSFYLWKS